MNKPNDEIARTLHARFRDLVRFGEHSFPLGLAEQCTNGIGFTERERNCSRRINVLDAG